MSNGIVLNREGARRMVKAVRAIEAMPYSEVGRAGARTPLPKETVWAKLTEQGDSDHRWYYAWSEVQRNYADAWQVVSGGRSGTLTENPAIEVNNTTDTAYTNKVVLLRRMPIRQADDSFKPGWGFAALGSGPGVIRFPARLTDSAGAFVEVYREGGAWVTLTGGRTHTSSIELNGAQGWVGDSGTGTVVMMEKVGGLWVFDYSIRIANNGAHEGYASTLNIGNAKGSHNLLGLANGAGGASLYFKGLADYRHVLQIDSGGNVIFGDVRLRV